MTSDATTVWEHKYSAGHRQLYPWDTVVSFVFRYAPRDRPRAAVRILEVGCGSASNLWFAAREGFSVAGIDVSASAIAAARERFKKEGLAADLHVGSFIGLPFAEASFDLVVDRGAVTCVGLSDAALTVAEVGRVLRPGGFFLFNPYADDHASAGTGSRDADGLTHGISGGTLVDVGPICFYRREDVERMLARGWIIHSFLHVRQCELAVHEGVHAEWRVIAEQREQ